MSDLLLDESTAQMFLDDVHRDARQQMFDAAERAKDVSKIVKERHDLRRQNENLRSLLRVAVLLLGPKSDQESRDGLARTIIAELRKGEGANHDPERWDGQ